MSTCSHSQEAEKRCSEEGEKRCPFFREGISPHCEARWGSTSPDSTELDVYCLGPMCVICPVFMRFSKTGRPLTQWEYSVEKAKGERLGFSCRRPVTISFDP
jgi:hypothetical protein